MKQRLKIFALSWLAIMAVMVLMRPIFMLLMPQYTAADIASVCTVMWHGMPNDLTMSTYLMWPVAVIMAVSVWTTRGIRRALNVWAWIVAAFMAVSYVVDAALFPYWDIRLDTTVIFYVKTSPAAAMASVVWWQAIVGIAAIALVTWLLHFILWRISKKTPVDKPTKRVWGTVGWVTLIAAMLIPARGGVTVGTMTPARGYYSDDMRLNKATTNPLFNFVYALCHPEKSIKTDYFTDADAEAQLAPLLSWCDSSVVSLDNKRPDIYLVVLESFSAHLMPSLGGEPIAVRLDSIAAEGISFTDFYAESFRTDRALSVIHAGFPSLPTESMLRDPSRFDKLPALARELRRAGYATHYYYGGDLDFTNCGAYFRSCGFEKVVGDSDFPLDERLSKWGAPDEKVFARALADAKPSKPTYTVIQTSSSHDPFDVPATLRTDDKRLNAFAYADSCLGAWVDGMKASGRWDNALIIISADHYGVWPDNLTDVDARHHVPLVITGGAIKKPMTIARTGSQSAIAPTVLNLLDLDHSMFPFAQNLLGTDTDGGWAWMSQPDYFALRRGGKTTVVTSSADLAADPTARTVQAFVQTLYNTYKK